MRKNLLFFVFFISSLQFFVGQEKDLKFNFASPTPFALTKFSGVENIIESSGKYSKEILLDNYNVGKLSLPISLIYMGAGVKVDQIASKTGINWSLNAGGVITRIVADKADEKWTRKFYTFSKLDSLSTSNAGVDEIRALGDNSYDDTEVDTFQFKFGNYAGSFYFDKNNQPQLINKREDITIYAPEFFNGNVSPEIVIITNEGTKYYFGGASGCESTRTIVGLNKSQPDITSFYLTKIENEIGNTILFQYLNLDFEQTLKQEISESYVDMHSFSEPYDSSWPTTRNSNHIKTPMLQKISGGKILEKIYSNIAGYEVNFTSRVLLKQDFYEVLDQIKIVKGNQNKSFKLNYISKDLLNNSSRFFLNKISSYVNDNFDNEHIFEYNNINEMPERLSLSKDFLGYANGSSEDTALNLTNMNVMFSGGPRSNTAPLFSKGVNGSLKKIIYPAGGSTNITYEPNKYWDYVRRGANIHICYNKPLISPSTKMLAGYPFDNQINPLSLPIVDQLANINLVIDTTTPNSVRHYKVKVELIDQVDNTKSVTKEYDMGYGNAQILKTIPVYLKANNTYLFIISLLTPPGASGNIIMEATAHINYSNDRKEVDGEGVRVRSIADFDGIKSIKRTFHYTKAQDINDTSKLERRDLSEIYSNTQPEFSSLQNYYIKSGSGVATTRMKRVTNTTVYSSGAYNSITLLDPEFYSNVSIEIGENFQNGLIEKTFIKNYDTFTSTFKPDNKLFNGFQQYSKSSNGSNFNGTLLNKRVFKNENGLLFMMKENINKYKEESANFIENIVTQKMLEQGPVQMEELVTYYERRLAHYFIGMYKTNELELLLKKTTERNYINPVPLNDLDNADNYKFLETVTDFGYSTAVFGIKKKVATTFPDKSVQEASFKYAHDKANQVLIAANMIGIPLETEVKKNGKIVSKSEVVYGNVYPISVKSYNLGNIGTPTTEVTYDRYDSRGNLQQYTTRSGIPTTIIWNLNKTLPIAKIEGIALFDISQSLIDSVLIFQISLHQPILNLLCSLS